MSAATIVEVLSLATGIEDTHGVPMKPSFVPLLNRADLVVLVGFDCEHAFLPALLEASKNPRIPPFDDSRRNDRTGVRGTTASRGGIRIVTTQRIYLADLTRNIGGEFVEVRSLATGVERHARRADGAELRATAQPRLPLRAGRLRLRTRVSRPRCWKPAKIRAFKLASPAMRTARKASSPRSAKIHQQYVTEALGNTGWLDGDPDMIDRSIDREIDR